MYRARLRFCTNILQLDGRLALLARFLEDLQILFLQAQTSYSWHVEVRPDQSNSGTQNIVLKINEGSTVVVDETISDVGGLAGGRLGVYCQSQEDIIWSRMATECI
jgi:hypothetical protein